MPNACLYACHVYFPCACHFIVYFPCSCLYCALSHACLYAFHSVLALRMPPRRSLCTFPIRTSMHVNVHFAYAIELCRTQRLYQKNPSQCFREKSALKTLKRRHPQRGQNANRRFQRRAGLGPGGSMNVGEEKLRKIEYGNTNLLFCRL